ncbi:MAG TPA: hypothetical protein ENN77_01315 [Candidatus Wirthbacteria bacterium]|nr:hypothetical protein [Candidatus Wirthbacteria bacterium]
MFVPSEGLGKYCLALDVGTELVKVLLFENENGTAKVLGVGRFKQRLQDMQSGMITDIKGVVDNCAEAIAQAEDQAGVQADQVIIGIAGELVKGMATYVSYERQVPTKQIEMKELEDIVSQIQWKAVEKVRQQLAQETGYKEIEVRLVNAAVVDVQIDSHRINNPLGFQGRKVNIGIFNSFAPLVHLGALQTIAEELNLDLLSIATEPYAVALSVGSEEAGEFSAIFIDIGGGTTDIALVKNGGVAGTKMFGLGGRAFTKRLSSNFGISFAQAEKMKLDYSAASLDPSSVAKVKEVLKADALVWMSGVEMIMEELAESEYLPSKILLCGGGSVLPEIHQVLEEFDWQENLPFSTSPQVRFIQPEEVRNVLDTTGQLVSAQDITPMALANLALGLMGEESLVDSVLRRVAKVMQQ